MGALGFTAGIALGYSVVSSGQHYYYHQQGWNDQFGVLHPAGYYSPEGYYWANGADIGYNDAVFASRRRFKINDDPHVMDPSRRRSDLRRRTNRGWVSSYSAVNMRYVNTMGFEQGISTGYTISRIDFVPPGEVSLVYWHDRALRDSWGVVHPVGYYTPAGYWYARPEEFGYCPLPGQPNYETSRFACNSVHMGLAYGVMLFVIVSLLS